MANKCEAKIGETIEIDLTRVADGQVIPLGNAIVTSALIHKKFGTWNMDVTVIDAEGGQVEITLAASETARMLEGEYIWEVTYTEPDGLVEKFPKNNEQVIFEMVKGA